MALVSGVEPYPRSLDDEAAANTSNGMGSIASSVNGVLKEALEDFKAGLSLTQVDEFGRTTLEHVKRKILSIQKEQERQKAMVGFSRMQFFLEKMGDFDELCQKAIMWGDESSVLSPWIWGPAFYILVKSREATGWEGWKDCQGELKATLINFETHSEVLGILYDAWQRQHDADFFSRVEGHIEQAERNAENIQQLIDRLPAFTDIDRRLGDFLAQLNEDRKKSGRHMSQDQEVSLHNEVWKDIRKQLNDHVIRSVDDRRVLGTLVTMFKHLRENMNKRFEQWEAERKENQRNDVLRWMSTPGMSQARQQEIFCSVQAPNTGSWIFDNHKIFSWMNDENPIASLVWLNGKMGAGKTILTSHIIEMCKKQFQGFDTSYFYCREHVSHQSSSLSVLKGILLQMAGSNQELLPYCNKMRIEGRQEFLDQVNVAKQLLEALCEYDVNQFVIIDGLDECEPGERKIILDFWRAMVEKTATSKPGKLRVLLVSQDVGDIRNAIQASLVATPLDLLPEDTDQDIRRYLETKAPEIQAKTQIGEAQVQNLIQLVYTRAEGMFLYATLTVENLLQQPNMMFYQGELAKNLPSDLADAYKKIIERLRTSLHANSWMMARNILSWLAGAQRPLQWHELQAALSIQLDFRGVRIDPRYRLHEDIRISDLCGPLVRAVRDEDDVMRLEFTHATTRAYIRSGKQNKGLNAVSIDYDATTKCLNYLALDCFKADLDEAGRQSHTQSGYYAMQDYAASEWGHHLQQLITTVSVPLLESKPHEVLALSQQLVPTLQRFVDFYSEIKVPERDLGGSEPGNGLLPVPYFTSFYPMYTPAGLAGPSSQPFATPGNNGFDPAYLHPPRSPVGLSPSPSPSSVSSRSPDPTGDPAEFCGPFKCFPELYRLLAPLWEHIYSHRRHVDSKEREKLSLAQLRTSLELTRKTIQAMSLEDDIATPNQMSILDMYGQKLYKCDRVPCVYFCEGFATNDELEKHLNRHDRPYHCPVNNCSVAPFGFANKKDCERHVRTYHPDAAEDGLNAFATGNVKASAEDIEARAKYGCTFAGCDKKYTRKANLDAHLDTHNGTRRVAWLSDSGPAL
ncbi:hypothetical protein PG991_006377 [Apiospora marii]|uniref:C2H2-type domain-containing protein n=1 Tax=Apiospora marii TaxID=335849 RepID=A0ABR1SBT3_9PEZI